MPTRIEAAGARLPVGLRPALVTATELTAVMAVIYRFHIEERLGLLRLLPLIGGGFAVHALLPPRYRRWWFLALSVAAILVVVPPLRRGVGTIVLALAVFAAAELAIAPGLRVGLLGIIVACMAGVRAGLLPDFGHPALAFSVVPLVASMFMFRLVIYMYDRRHEREPASLAERLGYFFLLPNPCFPMFPVVDYQTYRRTYYDTEARAIYAKGVRWMLRGVTHLLLYRVVFLYLVPARSDITGFGDVVRFVVSSYLIYLRVSGLFHLAVGMLCLFGFNLPETHRRYFLATSFTDFWRRINIFWKDFMVKIFYYPTFTALRSLGMKTRVVLATGAVFLASWLLHSYQYFWLHGTALLTVPDAAFWGILGVLVAVNALWELQAPTARRLGRREWDPVRALKRSAQTVATFACLSVLWSVLNSSSMREWSGIMAQGRPGLSGALWLVAAGVALVVIGVLAQRVAVAAPIRVVNGRRSETLPVLGNVAACALLFAAGSPALAGYVSQDAALASASLREEWPLWGRDAAGRGYYDRLLLGGQFAGEPRVVAERLDVLSYALLPSQHAMFLGVPFTTNEWGMRDKPYARAKPPGTFRIAVLGASYEVGAGVKDSETWEAQVETQLNESPPTQSITAFEIMNFSVFGYSLLHHLYQLEQRTGPFAPDLVLIPLYDNEAGRLQNHLERLLAADIPIPYPFATDALRRAGIRPGMYRPTLRRRLEPLRNELIAGSLRQIALVAAARRVPVVILILPRTEARGVDDALRFRQVEAQARAAGLATVALPDVFANEPNEAIQLRPWDSHPNVLGNRLIAAAVLSALRARASDLFDHAGAGSRATGARTAR